MQEKKELRKKAKEIRHSLDMETISGKIVENILKLDIYKTAKHVMLFYPLKHEVDLLKLLYDDKSFYLPRVKGEKLLVCPYKKGDELTISRFETEEPTTEPIDADILDVIFVPALMADKNLHRLGYGGGFYDKFLSKNALGSKRIVAIPNALILEKLPSEYFDAKIDIIICEDNVKY